MDLLEEPEVKKTYEESKFTVKLWEHKFRKKHKRVPSRLDIKEASREVRNAYKLYFKLKTAALEQSFKDVEGFDDDDDSGILKNESLDISAVEINNTIVCENNEALTSRVTSVREEPLQVSDKVWGAHLNHKQETEITKEKKELINPTAKITKKLFCGSKFSKRNPRKSLSFSQRNKSEANVENFSLSQPTPAVSTLPIELEESSSLSQNYFIFNSEIFKVVQDIERNASQSQPINIIQTVLENKYNRPLRKVDAGWLERVADKTGVVLDNLPLNCTGTSFKIAENTKIDYDSEDIIEESDEEDLVKNKILHVAKKRKIENVTHNSESNLHTVQQNVPKDEKIQEKEFKTVNENALSLEVSKEKSSESESIDDNTENIENSKESVKKRKPKSTVIKRSAVVRKNTRSNPERTTEITENMESPSKQPNNKSKSFKTPKKTKRSTKSESNSEVSNVELTPRRSARTTRVKVSLQEFSSGEEDPFYSDTDEKDPAFDPSSKQLKNKMFNLYNFEETDEEQTSPKKTKEKVQPKKRRGKKLSKEFEEAEEKEQNQTYELEYSVKPRIVAPRYSSLKKVLMENKIVIKGALTNKDSKENDDSNSVPQAKGKRQQAREKLEKKIVAGGLNDNFVTINIKKKVFVRGKKGKSFSQIKKAQWRSKKAKALAGPNMDMGGCDGGMLTCFNCGQIGHFARDCKAGKGDGLLPLNAEQDEECPYPTLEEASQMAQESVLSVRTSKVILQEKQAGTVESVDENDVFGDDIDSELLLQETIKLEEYVKQLDVQRYTDMVKVVQPYYKLKEDGSLIETPPEIYQTMTKFGHTSFRPGQEQVIMRILSGKSTLVTLSTGSGKSFCYQLPAYLYSQREPCISLIISPLVSLMDDQITGIAKFMKAGCLHSNQTKVQRQKILDAIENRELSVLLVSPEAVVAGEKQSGFGSFLRKLPPIAFACIDEAHCVSQWSHNFRPSYLMICRVLRESLGVKTILGLTATATRATQESIIRHLGILDGEDGVISDVPLPDNLVLTVSRDGDRDFALLKLLMSERFVGCNSIIVYCTRRNECERIAAFLRTSLKSSQPVEPTNKKRKRVNLQAEPYHAGLSASRRRTIQNAFMSGELRIVVATVAFGMGINKPDIRAVIHFNMPSSFESYVQEVGRAGRDGLKAQCHVFLDSKGQDENELCRHIHSNSIDHHVIRKLLDRVFVQCSCTGVCPKHEVAFSTEKTVRALDIPEENISTLLCYLELHPNKYIELLSPAYTICKIISYGGPLEIRKVAKDCPPLAMALALHKNKADKNPNILEFPVVEVASAMGWESGICKHKLKNLEWVTVNNQQKRSTISVQFSDLGFRLLSPGNLSADQLDEAPNSLCNRVQNQEQTALRQLHAIASTFLEVAKPSFQNCFTENDTTLKTKIREYFDSSNPFEHYSDPKVKQVNEDQLIRDIHGLISMYRDNNFTGRAIARIFHGIQSPNYPSVIWGRCKFWRSHLHEDFHEIVKIGDREILRTR